MSELEQIGFTDERLTGTGGVAFLAHAAQRLGLLPRLAEAVPVKRRARGASDAETQWALAASLAAGNGALSDVDALRGDDAQRELLGLREAPSSRRLCEFLRRLTKRDVERLDEVLRHLSARSRSRAMCSTCSWRTSRSAKPWPQAPQWYQARTSVISPSAVTNVFARVCSTASAGIACVRDLPPTLAVSTRFGPWPVSPSLA